MKKQAVLFIAIVAVLAFSSSVLAGPLDPREIALVAESTLVDLDTSMIAIHHGNDFGRSLQYASRIDDNAWNGRLWGVYGGKDVDIYYSGTVTPVEGETNQYQIAYTSDWHLDGQTGAGSGTALYTDPDFSFDIDWANLTVSGTISVSYGITTLSLTGAKDLTHHKLTVTGGASMIDLPLVGSAAGADLSFIYDQLTGDYSSNLHAQVLGGWLYDETTQINGGEVRKPPPPVPPPPPQWPNPPPVYPYPGEPTTPGFGDPGTPGCNSMTVTTVPEPSAVALAVTGGLPMLGAFVRKRRKAFHASGQPTVMGRGR